MKSADSILCAWCCIRVHPDGIREIKGRAVQTAFLHEGVPRELVIRLKFGGERWLAGKLAELSLLSWDMVPEEDDTLVPVPVSSRKLRERGYNQAALIAGAISRRTGSRTVNILARCRGRSQIGLTGRERKENAAGRFRLRKDARTTGRLWLVDDVMTTGATISESCAVLEDAGFSDIIPAVVCFRNKADGSMIQGKEVNHGGD